MSERRWRGVVIGAVAAGVVVVVVLCLNVVSIADRLSQNCHTVLSAFKLVALSTDSSDNHHCAYKSTDDRHDQTDKQVEVEGSVGSTVSEVNGCVEQSHLAETVGKKYLEELQNILRLHIQDLLSVVIGVVWSLLRHGGRSRCSLVDVVSIAG